MERRGVVERVGRHRYCGGVEFALTEAREFDYRVLASFSWKF